MKKIVQLFLLVLTVSLVSVSCKKDDSPSNDVKGNKYETTYMKSSMGEFVVELKTVEQIKEFDAYIQIDFRSDKTFWVKDGENSEWEQNGTWKQDGNKVTILMSADQGGNKEATVEDGVIKLSFDEEEDGDTISIVMHFSRI